MLRECCGHYDALSHMIRHPSIQNHIQKLPRYYRSVNAVCRAQFDKERAQVVEEHKGLLKSEASALVNKGVSAESAVTAMKFEHDHKFQAALESSGLMSYVYK